MLISGFVALTLSPMMCSRLLRHETRHGIVYRTIEGMLNMSSRRLCRLPARNARSRPPGSCCC
ncbi:MAG: hypothetical protein U1E17_01095 [Geminicoccaceae bacterium]